MLSVPSEPYTSILLYCKQNQKGSSIKDDGTKGEGVWHNVDKSGQGGGSLVSADVHNLYQCTVLSDKNSDKVTS